MKLNQLEALIALADGKGMAGAVEKLNISQPAITKSLSNLEHELGVELLDRSEYKLKLSKFGEILLVHARAISSEVQTALREIQVFKESGRTILRLSCSPGVIPKLVPQALMRSRKSLPDLTIEFSGDLKADDEQRYTELAEGVYDLLIYPIDKNTALDGFRFRYSPLLDMNMVIMASKDHPVTHLDNPTLADLTQYKWLFPASSGFVIERIKNAFFDAGLQLPENHLSFPARQILFSFLQSDECLAFVPSHPAILEDEAANFPVINVSMLSIFWTIYTIQRESTVPTNAMTVFIDSLHETIKETSQR